MQHSRTRTYPIIIDDEFEDMRTQRCLELGSWNDHLRHGRTDEFPDAGFVFSAQKTVFQTGHTNVFRQAVAMFVKKTAIRR